MTLYWKCVNWREGVGSSLWLPSPSPKCWRKRSRSRSKAKCRPIVQLLATTVARSSVLFLTVPGSWVIPTAIGYLLGSGLEVPTLPPLDLQHIPKQSAILLQCWRDPGGRISSGSRPGESLSTKRGGESAHEVWREGRGEAKFVRTCPGSQLPS